MAVKKKRSVSRAMPVRRKRRRSRKVKPAGHNDHALKFIQHYDPLKAEPYIPPRTEDYGVVPDNPQPITADELAFQRQYRKRRQ